MEDLFVDLTQLKSNLPNILDMLLEKSHKLPFEFVFESLILFDFALSKAKNMVVFVLREKIVNKPFSVWKMVFIKSKFYT